jgi:hypothetical protein
MPPKSKLVRRPPLAPSADEADWTAVPVPLVSSALSYALYSVAKRWLELGFTSGAVYRYYGVTRRKARYLIHRAPSKGRYFNRSIKREHAWRRVSAKTRAAARRRR